ncbi:hypothetical protein [Burkholderia stagnalis]|uniref:hypothetical protein n=1 Tax=Burkholderia stagnalis TaxID=1503054 RepID=UPI000F58CC50|nr:hypothetical protein [Burkholderia stagnalis]RQR09931.1 hypothetical protein DF026_36025 [Burkholderia stagnalis]RQR11353.1 hypothetical protein DF025_17475 [Burkholderia stagnalis]
MGLTKRELVVVDDTNREKYVVVIKESRPNLWTIELQFVDTQRMLNVETQRGQIKTWAKLSDAILFAQENCPHCRDAIVRIGSWSLSIQSRA